MRRMEHCYKVQELVWTSSLHSDPWASYHGLYCTANLRRNEQGSTYLNSRKIIDFGEAFCYNGKSFTVHDNVADSKRMDTLAGETGFRQSILSQPASRSEAGQSACTSIP